MKSGISWKKKILNERYRLLFGTKKKEKHILKIKMIEDQYNEIMTMNERSTHATLESNVR